MWRHTAATSTPLSTSSAATRSDSAVVLAKLNELLATISDGDAVHLVSDDPTAYVEMVRWTEQTGNSLVEWRTEGSLFHFIVRKTR